MLITFVDIDESFCEAVREQFALVLDGKGEGAAQQIKVQCRVGSVADIPPRKDLAFVAPNNCLLYMDGGIDMVYSRTMFTDLEPKAKDMVKRLGLATGLGRPYLPIGSAIVVPVDRGGYMVCAPTMFLPQNVASTNNAYVAFCAALAAATLFNRKYKGVIRELVVPGLCTGVGGMDVNESARQLRMAYDTFTQKGLPASSRRLPWAYMGPSHDDEQPPYYENLEIKKISIGDIIQMNTT